jgi:regulator of sigma E protease
LSAGQEIVSIDGEPTSGWAVNLQLVRRLGESGTLQVLCARGRHRRAPRELAGHWLKGADEPDPIRRWVFALAPGFAAGAGRDRSKGPAQPRA